MQKPSIKTKPSNVQFAVTTGFQKRLTKACEIASILLVDENIDSLTTGEVNNLIMLCVDKGVSLTWILEGKGKFWFVTNDVFHLFGTILSFKGAFKYQNWN